MLLYNINKLDIDLKLFKNREHYMLKYKKIKNLDISFVKNPSKYIYYQLNLMMLNNKIPKNVKITYKQIYRVVNLLMLDIHSLKIKEIPLNKYCIIRIKN